MKVMNGKHTFARIMTEDIDDTSLVMINRLINHPAFRGCHISIMPDVHAGIGSVIGFTCTTNNYVIPNIIGVDIGCGVFTVNLGKSEPNFKNVDNFVKNEIPHGKNVRKEQFKYDDYNYNGSVELAVNLAENLGLEPDRVRNSIGTLGGGNHFIEIGVDADGNYWLTIHSGSRNFGLRVAKYHQGKAKELCEIMLLDKDFNKDLEYLPISHGGQRYLYDMKIAQCFASWNRNIMAIQLYKYITGKELDFNFKIESIHNYIDLTHGIIRKGAISAYEGEMVVIPFNMADGIVIGIGLGNKEWNFSAPHGSGRLFSRTRAKESLTMEEFMQDMKDVYSTSITKNTLDESPRAYKNTGDILSSLSETVAVLSRVVPVYNFKSN